MPRVPPALAPLWPYLKAAYTTSTRAFAPVSRQVARLSSNGGPRAVAMTVEEAVAGSGGTSRMWVVREPATIERGMPRGTPPDEHHFTTAAADHIPRVAVAVLDRARVDGRFGAVITRDNRLVHEVSTYFGTSDPQAHPQFLRPLRRAPIEHPGTVAVLASRGDDNYFHFMTDVLPKLALFADCPDLPEIDAYYVPANRPFQRELLTRCGVAPEKIIDSRQSPYLRAARLVVAGLPDAHLRAPQWMVTWLRETLLAGVAPVGARRRLYLTRGTTKNTRIVRNERDVMALLDRLGFEPFDAGRHNVVEQIEALASAEIVVAPHGAAVTNVVFCSQPATVIEIFTPGYVNTCYWALACHVPGLDYRYVLGAGDAPPGNRDIAGDIEVDPAELAAILADVGAAGPN